ncbi:DUF1877 family protein [Rubritalea spongiae]|uniref:DUF1877 family protein n=1 Tax=Rubritalea spongiae TaxID=430797 RepID=A0ABW5DZ68_9BACT
MITTFTRVQTDDLDDLIQDEELVISLVTELGFDANILKQLAGNAEATDPETLFHTLENRWNGHGQVFSLEDQAELLSHIVQHTESLKDSPLATLPSAGRATPINIDNENVRVLFPSQIDEINDALIALPVETLQAHAQQLTENSILKIEQAELISAPLWQLYDGLCTFFQNATDADEYILLAKQTS